MFVVEGNERVFEEDPKLSGCMSALNTVVH